MAYPDLGLLVTCPGGWPLFRTKTVAAQLNEGKHATANLKSKRHAVAEGQVGNEDRSFIKAATASNWSDCKEQPLGSASGLGTMASPQQKDGFEARGVLCLHPEYRQRDRCLNQGLPPTVRSRVWVRFAQGMTQGARDHECWDSDRPVVFRRMHCPDLGSGLEGGYAADTIQSSLAIGLAAEGGLARRDSRSTETGG
ncbi:hypothetical protein XPA_006806 [Xanthoria parietina]